MTGVLMMISMTQLQGEHFSSSGKYYPLAEVGLLSYPEGILGEENSISLESKDLYHANMEGVAGISTAEEKRSFTVEVDHTITEDIKDANNATIIKKGTKINPLNSLLLATELIFLDGTDPKQVEWALAQGKNTKMILIKGDPMPLIRKNRVRFFADQNGICSKRFQIKKVPSIVRQEGNVLRVEEVPINGGSK